MTRGSLWAAGLDGLLWMSTASTLASAAHDSDINTDYVLPSLEDNRYAGFTVWRLEWCCKYKNIEQLLIFYISNSWRVC